MMPFHLFILTIFKKVSSNGDAVSIANNQRVQKLMDRAHEKSAHYTQLF
ncbi:hypothetical protein [Alkalihalobacillus sp. AL-G]|nr:hypothetical protein [Alkalihalobacillus sp. AL-G]WLD92175.1 hypothetical protein MOJ78_14235 [Alkalihalobacillus sp. AL-G]